jgi:hypothetical protein
VNLILVVSFIGNGHLRNSFSGLSLIQPVSCPFVALRSVRDLLFCAKHLFVEAMMAIVSAQGGSMMSNGTSLALNSEQDLASIPTAQRGPFPPGYRAPQKGRRTGGASS